MSTPTNPDPSSPDAIRRNLHALPAIVYSALPDLRLDFLNQRAAEYFGLVFEEVAGQRWIDLVHPDDRDSVLAAWDAARATGRYRHEHRLRLAGGQYGRFRAEALLLRDSDGADREMVRRARPPRRGQRPESSSRGPARQGGCLPVPG